jgi:hypothetical protein
MRRVIPVFVLVCIFFIQISSQNAPLKLADSLRRFEVEWLTANLNGDRSWLTQFSEGKTNVLPPADNMIEGREEAIKALIATPLQSNEMKVRISGTIRLLTNDPKQNRSYFFLDTFNRIDGKWKVIASSISPADVNESTDQIKQNLLELENEWSSTPVSKGDSILDKILNRNFVETSPEGIVLNRDEWIESQKREGITSGAKSEMQVRVINGSLAIVTGVDRSVRPNKDGTKTAYANRFTHTWSKNDDGQWQCVASQHTRLGELSHV